MRPFLLQLTSKITAFAKSGNISCARNLFDEMPLRDTVAWNAMISGYSHMNLFQEALTLFTRMRSSDVNPDHFTHTAVLSACSGLKDIQFGRRLHALVIISGSNLLLPVNNALIDMYGKCSSAEEANKVFEEMRFRNEVSWCSLLFAYLNVGLFDVSLCVFYDMPRRVLVAWNTIIAGYAKWGEVGVCLDLFKKMLGDSCSPDQWTLSSIMSSCVQMNELCLGYMFHCFIIKIGWNAALEVNNSVLSFYVKLGEENEVLEVVKAVGMHSDVSWNVIIDAYMQMGNLDEASLAFECAPKKNIISWTSMISGYMRNGRGECAMKFFVDLMRSGIRPDDVAFGAVLHACSNMVTLGHGRMVHGCIIRSGFHSYTYVGNGLVNMYAKCGDICNSRRAFSDIANKDLVSWNTLLFAFGLHGCAGKALSVLDEMAASGGRPDKVTFIGILMTCNHLGLINAGLAFLESMTSNYCLSPEIDHVACVVDMLGRGGRLEKAKELANQYFQPNNAKVRSLEALLGCYSYEGNLVMGAELADQLQILKPNDEMSYVLLSNMYCASGQWKQAQNLRKTMVDQGLRKMPGCSWIEVGNEVAAFVAGSNSFPYEDEVRVLLHAAESEMKYPAFFLCWDEVS